jgi:SAM-dependent methyltransferase
MGQTVTDKTSYIKTNKPLYIKNLVARMLHNEQFGAADFEKWVFQHLNIQSGAAVMDIACGNGKAIFKLVQMHPEIGQVVGVDFAETAIASLRAQATSLGHKHVEGVILDMEKLTEHFAGQKFDNIYSIYGIHYSPRMAEILIAAKALLKPTGTIFVCGPDAFCNTKVMRVISRYDDIRTDPIPPRMLLNFISEAQLNLLRQNFARVDLDYFENPIRFPSVDAFFTWWVNHDLYRAHAEDEMRRVVAQEIAETGAFTLNKNAMGFTLHTN